MTIPSLPNVYFVGVGMTNFVKPNSLPDWDYPEMVKESVTSALKDADLKYDDIQQAVAAFLFGETCSGQRALYPLGMTGIPIYNVNNACASGSSALNIARQVIQSGNSDCVLVVGFEKMKPGSLENAGMKNPDSVHPMDKHIQVISDTFGLEASPMTAQMFGNAAREHMKKYGTKAEHFAKVALKNHKHSVHNPRSQFRKEYTMDEISNSKMVHYPLTKLQCCPTSDGSAAVILCNDKFLDTRPHLKKKAVKIVGMTMATDLPSTFAENSNIKMIGFDATKKAAADLYSKTRLSPDDVQVIELHDCFSANELITYEALGLCPEGKAGELIDKCQNTYGGRWVINPSGGLISKGHPIGATGIAQCAELCWQLRGECGKRQVPNVKYALQHNIGIGGAVVVAIYKLAFPQSQNAQISTKIPLVEGRKSASFNSDLIFHKIKEESSKNGQSMVENVGATFKFTISNGKLTKVWIIDCSKLPVLVQESSGKSDCEIIIGDNDMVDMALGKISPDKLFMTGKLKIKGNITKAMKLRKVFDGIRTNSKL